MQLSSPTSGGSPTVTQTATTVAQGVPQNQQNIVMVILILRFNLIKHFYVLRSIKNICGLYYNTLPSPLFFILISWNYTYSDLWFIQYWFDHFMTYICFPCHIYFDVVTGQPIRVFFFIKYILCLLKIFCIYFFF